MSIMGGLMQVIIDHDWAVQGVVGDTPGECWQYTIGMFMFDHPEFIMTGLPAGLGQTLLNDLGGRVRDGATFHDGQIISDLIANFDVKLVEVDANQGDWFNVALSLVPELRAFQVVWPDKDGVLPEGSLDSQPLLEVKP